MAGTHTFREDERSVLKRVQRLLYNVSSSRHGEIFLILCFVFITGSLLYSPYLYLKTLEGYCHCDHAHHGQICAPEIDVVYTWVNGTDEELSRVREVYRAEWVAALEAKARNASSATTAAGSNSSSSAAADTSGPDNATLLAMAALSDADRSKLPYPYNETVKNLGSKNQYRENDELRYSLRSVERYAPWVRHVFIVTDGQIPSWLDTSNPRVSVVTHADIFMDRNHLPVFSSPAIEANLHRIPGLSDRFIYLNDDVMFGTPVWPDDFFTLARGQKVYLSWTAPGCAKDCSNAWLGDGYCDLACNVSNCHFDRGDCENVTAESLDDIWEDEDSSSYRRHMYLCSDGCLPPWIGDKYCDKACENEACGFDGADCGIEKMTTGMFFYNLTLAPKGLLQPAVLVPANASSAAFNLSAVFTQGGVKDASHTNLNLVHAASISQKHMVLTLVFNDGYETSATISIRGTAVDGNETDFVFSLVRDIDLASLNLTEVSEALERQGSSGGGGGGGSSKGGGGRDGANGDYYDALGDWDEFAPGDEEGEEDMDGYMEDFDADRGAIKVHQHKPGTHAKRRQRSLLASGGQLSFLGEMSTTTGAPTETSTTPSSSLPSVESGLPSVMASVPEMEPRGVVPQAEMPAFAVDAAAVGHVERSVLGMGYDPALTGSGAWSALTGATVMGSDSFVRKDSLGVASRDKREEGREAGADGSSRDPRLAVASIPVQHVGEAAEGPRGPWRGAGDSVPAWGDKQGDGMHQQWFGEDKAWANSWLGRESAHMTEWGHVPTRLGLQAEAALRRIFSRIDRRSRRRQQYRDSEASALWPGEGRVEEEAADEWVLVPESWAERGLSESSISAAVESWMGTDPSARQDRPEWAALQALLRSAGAQGASRRRLLDMFSSSLQHVDMLLNEAFGPAVRKVPAHMPHMIDKHVLLEMHDSWHEHFLKTSSNRFRSEDDMQFAFSYFYFLMSKPRSRTVGQLLEELDVDNSGGLNDNELRTLVAKITKEKE
eukprot:jgi/Mesvir1/22605/Mv14053-RA.4